MRVGSLSGEQARPTTRVRAALLAIAGTEALAENLVALWRDWVPAVDFHVITVRERHGVFFDAPVQGSIAALCRPTLPLLLVGFCGTEALALQLAADLRQHCQGSLAISDIASAPDALGAWVLTGSMPVRFVWQSSEPLASAEALGLVLARCRACGQDARGLALPKSGSDRPLSAATMRAARAFLAELVAITIGSPVEHQLWRR